MSPGEQSRRARPKPEEDQEAPEASAGTEEKAGDVDDLLDEIDEVLESNAEEFVRSFVQKGGQ